VQVSNQTTTIARGRTRLKERTKREKQHLTVSLTGQIRAHRQRRFRRRVARPELFVGMALRYALRKEGITLGKKQVRVAKAPKRARVLALVDGPPLGTVVQGMGKYSNNFIAEMLLKVVGAEFAAKGKAATWQHGILAVEHVLQNAGIAPASYVFENGSGLFSSNQIAPAQITTLLRYAFHQPLWRAEFFAALAIAGNDGTLKKRMEGNAWVRAKTGTLDHVSALSGVVATNMHPIFFSILVNDFPKHVIGDVRTLQDKLVMELVHALTKVQALDTCTK